MLAPPDWEGLPIPHPTRWETTMVCYEYLPGRNVFFCGFFWVGKKNIHKGFGNPSLVYYTIYIYHKIKPNAGKYTIYMNPMGIESQLESMMNSQLQKSEKDNPPIQETLQRRRLLIGKIQKKQHLQISRCFQKKKRMPIPPSSPKKTSGQVKQNDLDLPHTKEYHLHHQDYETSLGSGIPTSTLALATKKAPGACERYIETIIITYTIHV